MKRFIPTAPPILFASLFLLSNIASATSVTIRDGALQTEGLAWKTAPAPGAYTLVPGPLPGITGIAARERPVTLTGALDKPVQRSGSLSFWFATDRAYRSGAGQPAAKYKLVEVRDTFSVKLTADASSVTLMVEWGGPKEIVSPRHIRIILPEFPGPAWHHFALSWDGGTGVINAFLDGTPYYVPGEKVAPIDMLPGSELALHLGALAFADVRLDSAPLTAAALDDMLPAAYKGQLDGLLGARDLGPCPDLAALRGKTLYANTLAAPADTAAWVLEGPGEIAFHDGWMDMTSQRPDGPEGHLVYWCPEKFPERFVAEWDFELIGEKGLCILFFAAKGRYGKDLFDPSLAPRAGIFNRYTNGDIDCYHISYFANTPAEPRRVANLRKNHGFHLISNGPVGVSAPRPGEVHRAVLIKDGAHIRMAVDGRIIIDHIDDGKRAGPVHTDGRIGFRQMQWTHACYRNFRVSELKP